LSRFVRMIAFGFFGDRIASAPRSATSFSAPWYRLINRFSAILAVSADIGLIVMGGSLKFREMLSARMGDVLSQLFIASSILKYHASLPADPVNDAHAEFALRRAFIAAQRALLGFYENFPVGPLGWLLKHLAFPLRMPVRHASDHLTRTLGTAIMEPHAVRDAISEFCYHSTDENDGQGLLEVSWQLLREVEPTLVVFRRAQRKHQLQGETFAEQLDDAIAQGVVAADQKRKLLEYERLRRECLFTDVFDMQLKEWQGRA
jgi:acyl-CoA dehydrogenase